MPTLRSGGKAVTAMCYTINQAQIVTQMCMMPVCMMQAAMLLHERCNPSTAKSSRNNSKLMSSSAWLSVIMTAIASQGLSVRS